MNKLIKILLLQLAIPFLAYTQKLASKQQLGIWIPGDSKIDGKATEWNNKFQAYNKSIEAFYTIANDDKNLYLIVKAADQLVIRKIIAGSITFSVSPDEHKKSKDVVAITYPVFDADNLPNVNLKNQPASSKDAAVSRLQLDSFMRVANQQVVDKSKKIKITGSAALEDTLVSVYNQQGIKVVSHFDNKIAYTCEWMIPFKYLGISSNQGKFYYNIKLNGSVRSEGSFIENIPGGVRVNGPVTMADMQFISSATDLSNEYIIAKK